MKQPDISKACWKCLGKGVVPDGFEDGFELQKNCPVCHGTGSLPLIQDSKDPRQSSFL